MAVEKALSRAVLSREAVLMVYGRILGISPKSSSYAILRRFFDPRKRGDRTGRAKARLPNPPFILSAGGGSGSLPQALPSPSGTLYYPKPFPTCELCGEREGAVGHHRNLDHSDNREENRQRLCTECHQSLHNAIAQVRKLFRRSYRISRRSGRSY